MAAMIEALEFRTLLSAGLPGLVPLHKAEATVRVDATALTLRDTADARSVDQDLKRLGTLKADGPLLRGLATADRAADRALHKDVTSVTGSMNTKASHLIIDVIRAVRHPNNQNLADAANADRQSLISGAESAAESFARDVDSTTAAIDSNLVAIGAAHAGDSQTQTDIAAARSRLAAGAQTIKSAAGALTSTLDDLLSGF